MSFSMDEVPLMAKFGFLEAIMEKIMEKKENLQALVVFDEWTAKTDRTPY